jgi:hypothetical protein
MTTRNLSRVVLIALVGLAGCASSTPTFDEQFSKSLRTLQAQQVLNPNATQENSRRVPEGMDGRAARETLERYQKSFQQPSRPASSLLSGGGGAGAGGGSND